MAKRNFTKGFKIYNQFQKFKKTGEKKYLLKSVNAIMEYREMKGCKNVTEFDFNGVFNTIKENKLDEAYTYLNQWFAENDKDYDGENWYGETYQ